MRSAFRSELIRIWRPSFIFGGIGVMAGFAALISIFIFTSAKTVTADQPAAFGRGPGSYTVAQLASPGGFLTALATVSRSAGVVVLALWAISVATDYSTGLIRILVQAQPRRVKLMAGKIIALVVFTLLAATVTALVAVLIARPLARLEGIRQIQRASLVRPRLVGNQVRGTPSESDSAQPNQIHESRTAPTSRETPESDSESESGSETHVR